MPKSRRCCIFVLLLGGLHLVTGYVSISGCSGASTILYRGITFNSDNIVVYLHKNGDNNTLLAMWSKQNNDPVKGTYENGYGKKLSLDNGDILIRNLSKSDEGKYVIEPALGTWSMKIEVHLVVLVAPPKQCTPNITRVKNTLVASLDIEDCGNPAAHVSWYKLSASERSRRLRQLKYPGERKRKTISTIVVGKEAGTYYACAESSAMHCIRKSGRFDFCSFFKKEKDTILPRQPEKTTSSELSDLSSELSDLTKRSTYIHSDLLELQKLSTGIIILAVVAVIVILIILYRRCKDPSKDQNTGKTLSTDKVLSPSGNPELLEENGTLLTTTIESEVWSPTGRPRLPEENETLMTPRIDSEVSPPSGNPDLSEQIQALMTTRIDSEVSAPSGKPKLPEEHGTLTTTTIESEVSSPSGSPVLSEEKKTSVTTTNYLKETTVSVCSESITNGLKSPGPCIKLPKSPAKESTV